MALQTDSTRVVSHIPRTEGDEAQCYGYMTRSKWDLHTITITTRRKKQDRLLAATRRALHGRMGLFPGKAYKR